MSQRADLPDDLDDFVAESAANDPAFAVAHERANIRSGLLRAMVAWRKRTKRSQTAIAKAMGTTQSAVSELEGGGVDPRFSTLDRYATAIGCRLQIELLSEAGERLYVSPQPWRSMSSWTLGETGNWEQFSADMRKVFAAIATATAESAISMGPIEEPLTADNFALAA